MFAPAAFVRFACRSRFSRPRSSGAVLSTLRSSLQKQTPQRFGYSRNFSTYTDNLLHLQPNTAAPITEDFLDAQLQIRERVISAAYRGDRATIASCLEQLEEPLDLKVCEALLHYYCSIQDTGNFEEVWKRMVNQDFQFRSEHFLIRVQVYQHGHRDKVVQAVRDCMKCGIRPSQHLLLHAMHALAEDRSFQSPETTIAFLEEIAAIFEQANYPFNSLALSYALKVAARLDNFRLAWKLYQQYLSSDASAKADTPVYNQLLKIVRHSQLSKKQILTYTKTILEDMARYNAKLTHITIFALYPIIGMNGNAELLDQVVRLIKERQIPPDARQYKALIGAYAAAGSAERLKEVYREAVASRTYDEALLKAAANHFIDFNEFGLFEECIKLLEPMPLGPEHISGLQERLSKMKKK